MKKIWLLVAISICNTVSAQTAPPAKEMACRACHGASGAAPIAEQYPKLNGQNKAYLVSSLKAYKAGERKGGLSALMVAQSSMLSDADIKALADYYSSQK